MVKACLEERVAALVYTSSASVVFDGDQDLKGVDEMFPCASKVRPGSKEKRDFLFLDPVHIICTNRFNTHHSIKLLKVLHGASNVWLRPQLP